MERQKDRLLWIGGHYQQGTDGEFFDNLNPATGEVICRVAVAGAKDVDQAVRAARDGLAQWRAMDGTARGRVLMRAAQLLREQRDDLAR
ncbi:MAG TPA: betaine-aldehyde dehydrogenase, partial [Alcanivorax sp.]|nr:betaine-aldehyde dehydrogenase [Alcanivorax sp.]HCI12233.1 betaine-aldehyde dehydrogenase [Alcanivorax sp.]